MRINDKHLARIAVGNTPIDKEGFLTKRGEVNKSFQKRYFVLKGNLLFYFEKKKDKDPVGVIIIEGCTVELTEITDAFTFELVFPGSSSRTYILAAQTQEEMESWMKAITCASYDYMKLMVAELQRQVDDLNEEQKARSTTHELNSRTKNAPKDFLGDTGISDHFSTSGPFSSPGHPEHSKTFAPDFPDYDDFSKPFEQLHGEYGSYIMQKMREAQITL